MIYALNREQENELLLRPETGMGYQIIEVKKANSYEKNRYIVLNSELAVDMNTNYNRLIGLIMNVGVDKIKSDWPVTALALSSFRVLSETEFKNMASESRSSADTAAIDNPKESADGQEEFMRLSAFQDDKRIDRIKKCLRPGSFTTTKKDYLTCKNSNDDPVERYALPNEEKIEWAFLITPKKNDVLQKGKVQPAYGKRGGGIETYFENGTSIATFVGEMRY
jgi:hypothetical protein